jgi:uncharacterized protein YjbI with pentapeptide repeats
LLAGLQAASAPAPTDPYSRRHAHLSRATLFAQLADNLSGADLSGVNRGANLSGADLRSASLSGANLSGANLSGARNLTQTQLVEACGTDAKLDPGLTLKPCQ